MVGLGPASTKPLLTAGLYPYANEAHDDWLAALSERGVLGLFALLLLGGCVIARASPVLRRPLSAPMAAAVPFPAGIVAAMLALSVNSFYEEVLHFRPLWLLFGIVAVLGRDAWRVHRASRQRRFARLRPAALSWSGDPAAGPGAAGGDGRPRPLSLRRPPAPPVRRGGLPLRRGSARLAVAVQAGHHEPGRAGRRPGRAVDRQPARRQDRRSRPCSATMRCMRVLPWLFGVIFSCGLPTASAFFLAGEHGKDRRVAADPRLMAVVGAAVSSLAWLACAVPFHHVFFKQMPLSLVWLMTISVVTSLWNVTAKACCQGSGDIPGANLLIVAEEFWFLPIYLAVRLATGQGGSTRSSSP